MTEEQRVTYEYLLRQGGDRMLREASAYFAGEGRLHGALRRLTQRLNAEGIPYALLGGLALAEHGYPRLTEDIDLLLTPSGLERFRQHLVGRGYRLAFSGAEKTFRDTETGVRIEIVTAGEYPGDGLPKPVAFPDPATPGVTVEIEGIRVVALEKLIELKLASGMSASHRLRDLADVQDLITRLRLPLTLADRLDPSVQAAYRDLWEKARTGKLTGSHE
ncbi:MAG: nucleotidyltransferase family protein [Anaerolineae bacterium]|nr:nucleotidyltransferase family protein [Anaerolineae bacterium]